MEGYYYEAGRAGSGYTAFDYERVKGLEPAREISLVRSAGRSPTRAAEAFVAFARERL